MTLCQETWEMCRNTLAIRTAAPLPYFLIIAEVTALEKVSFSDIKIIRLFFNRLTVDEKHYLLNREN